ncbi:CASP-like protein 4D1, partial [Diospyros lotus]|uniref:CASP-like protein 4D1 n=1 Tax=Diospyros lotus TaxID=55363 RepID=UPI002255E564
TAGLPEFDFYADKIMSFLLAAGAGAGFAVSFELKRLLGGDDEISSKTNAFFINRANIATAILLLGFVSMAVLLVLSSTARAQYYASQSKGPITKARGCF